MMTTRKALSTGLFAFVALTGSALAQQCPCDYFGGLPPENWSANAPVNCQVTDSSIYASDGNMNIVSLAVDGNALVCGHYVPGTMGGRNQQTVPGELEDACIDEIYSYISYLAESGYSVSGCPDFLGYDTGGQAAPAQTAPTSGTTKDSAGYCSEYPKGYTGQCKQDVMLDLNQ